jgi:head-tail adaptor
MRAGKLNNRASIQRRNEDALDDFGNVSSAAWEDVVTARACSIRPDRGNEETIADRLQSVVTYVVTFRYAAAVKAVNAGDSLFLSRAAADLDSGARLNILHDPIDPTGRRDRLEFRASFGDAAG